MTTSKKFRNLPFVPNNDQISKLQEFENVRGTLSIRKQCQYLSKNLNMTTGEIAKYLEVRFQQVYQATH